MQAVFDEKLKELEVSMKYLIKEAEDKGYGFEKVDEVVEEYYALSDVSAYETQEPCKHVEKIEGLIKRSQRIFE